MAIVVSIGSLGVGREIGMIWGWSNLVERLTPVSVWFRAAKEERIAEDAERRSSVGRS